MQTKPYGTASPAYLDAASNAGQFHIVDSQLIMYTSSTPLYMNVENPADKTQRALATWFDTTPNEYGAFAFQGDTLIWSVADIERPNLAAWLVCGEQELFINTGAYLWETPVGCVDQTVSLKAWGLDCG